MEEITMLILCNLIRSPKHTSYFGVHQGCDGFDPSPDGLFSATQALFHEIAGLRQFSKKR